MANSFSTGLDGSGLYFAPGGDLDLGQGQGQGQGSKTFRGQTWTEDETLALIQLFRDEGFQQELEGVTRNKHIFHKLASKLISLGFNRDGEQCRTKLKNLKLQYNAVSQGFKDKVNMPRSLLRYWDSLEELWGAGGGSRDQLRPASHSLPITPAAIFRADHLLTNDSSNLWEEDESVYEDDIEDAIDDLAPRGKRRKTSETIDNADDDVIRVKVEPGNSAVADSVSRQVTCSTPHDAIGRQQDALLTRSKQQQRVSTSTTAAVRPPQLSVGAVERPELVVDRMMTRFIDRQRDSESRFLQFELRLAEVASQRRREEREFELRVQDMWSRALFQQQYHVASASMTSSDATPSGPTSHD